MTREEIQTEILSLGGSNWLLELATGWGKSKMALDKIRHLAESQNKGTLLIVVPRVVHKANWKLEVMKWWSAFPISVSYVTYVSFPKLTQKDWDYVIFDECHHLSERCREALSDFNIKHSVLLSATVGKKMKNTLSKCFNNLISYKRTLRDTIDDQILPDPKVYLLPLQLNTEDITEVIWKNKSAKKKVIECNWTERWSFIKQKESPVKIHCTQRQYLSDLNKQILYWKGLYERSRREVAKNKWLRLCNDRLKWLSDKKVGVVQQILSNLKHYRTLTFCNSIDQTERLGKYCINSKNGSSLLYLQRFNDGQLNHITACNMLNEGMNLADCQIGIYANLNSSETIVKQRMGRLLRHKNPVIIVPYFENSRDEELVNKMIEDYNPELVTVIKDIKDIKI